MWRERVYGGQVLRSWIQEWRRNVTVRVRRGGTWRVFCRRRATIVTSTGCPALVGSDTCYTTYVLNASNYDTAYVSAGRGLWWCSVAPALSYGNRLDSVASRSSCAACPVSRVPCPLPHSLAISFRNVTALYLNLSSWARLRGGEVARW